MEKVKGYSHVYRRDLGMALIVKNLKQLDNSYTKVGFPSEASPAKGKPEVKPPVTTMSEMSTIAFYNEYGTKTIPARPFLSLAYYRHVKGLKDLRDKLYAKVISGQITVRESLAIMGEWFAAKVKRTIDDVTTPPNAPSTIKKKNAALLRRTSKKKLDANPLIGTTSHPLIHTAQMRNSVTHVEVVK